MKRPLFTVALCLVIVCAIWLGTGGAKRTEDDFVLWENLANNERIALTGQVYQKDEESIYLKSIVISDSYAFGQSAAESQQVFSNNKAVNNSIRKQLSKMTLKGNIVCRVMGADEIPLGTKVLVEGEGMIFEGARNPGEFDARKYYRSIGIVGRLTEGIILGKSESNWPFREWLYRVKGELQFRIYQVFPEGDAAVIEALLLGEKGNLDSELKGLYQRNGILHILSISAMHVSIVGMGIYQLLRRTGMPIWLAAVCGSMVLFLYGGLTGFGVSAVRAIGMYLLRMLAEVVGRTYDMLTALGLVGMLMVLYHPYYLQNGGFLLSFSCVLGIGVLYPVLLPDIGRYQGKNRELDTPWKRLLDRLGKAEIPRKVVSSFFISISVTLATLPVQLYLYYEVPTFSVFLNLLVIPLLKPLMITGIVSLVLPLAFGPCSVVSGILGWYELICGWFDKLPCNTWNPGCPKSWQIVVYYGLLLGVILWKKGMKRQEKLFPFLSIAFGIVVLGMGSLRSNIIFLDVGQGSCCVLQLSSGENYVFDCGSTSRSKVGEYVLLPYLKYAGIHCLDGVFVSHPDEDHSSGVLELFECAKVNDIVVEQLILPDVEDKASKEQMGELIAAAQAMNLGSMSRKRLCFWGEQGEGNSTRVAYVSRGNTWQCEGARFLCLHPYKDYSGADSNQYSQCIYVEFVKQKWFGEKGIAGSLFLTGDVGKDAERELAKALEEYKIGDVTLFQGAHHGSKYSNSKELLQLVRPKVTVISCGRNNSYGHPHKETLERLEEVGSMVLSTPEYGAIEIVMGRKITLRCWGR